MRRSLERQVWQRANDICEYCRMPQFDPRRDQWPEHFEWRGAKLVGRTAIGRATIVVLAINDPVYAEVREDLMLEGVFPPPG